MSAFAARVLRPFQQFVRTESASGVVLLACTAAALAWANSPWSESYFHLWERTFTVGFEGLALTKTLHHWINDGLMVVFFFLVGLEIKRELLVGELASPRRAALPIAGAVGGMLVPAALFAALNAGGPGAKGWGIPMATDIAFAIGVLALLGPRVPTALKVFLTALAIVDDMGAVLVIALFYTADISLASLGAAGLVLALLVLCNASGVRHAAVYAVLGVLLWLAVLKSGIHATIAGVLLAMTIPARTRIDEDEFLARGQEALDEFRAASDPVLSSVLTNPRQQEALHRLERHVDEVQAPLLTMEHAHHGIVAFGIMPLFAFANSGVRVTPELLGSLAWSVVLGVLLGLVVGKPLGITLASWLAARARLATVPAGVRWSALHAVSWLGGIGFTMSLFVADLAYGAGPLLDSAKIGILAASLLAGAVGWVLLRGRAPEEAGTGDAA
jgi:NhaA family Na+:H+ antiporter